MNTQRVITLITLSTAIALFWRWYQAPKKTLYTVALFKTASHPSLDLAEKGFVDILSERLGKKISFLRHNAQGSLSNAALIARQLHNDPSITAFYTIATPATIAMAHLEKKRPIIISAVTNPSGLSLISPETNVCGSTDMMDSKKTVDVLCKVAPEAKEIAILYTIGEKNSTYLVQALSRELKDRGLVAKAIGAPSESELVAATERAITYDAIIAPTDNNVASAIAYIAQKACEAKKPLIIGFGDSLIKGATAIIGVNYYQSGRDAGECLLEILKHGKKPAEILFRQGAAHVIIAEEEQA